MVMSWTRTLLQGFLWPWTLVAVTWRTAMSVRVQLQSGRAPATRRGKAGKNKTKTVTGCDVWCREHVRWRREAALGQWWKEVRLSRSSLVRKSRSSVAMWEVKWTRIGCSKPREKIQESKALQNTTLQTSCSTSSERKYHPHVLGITWTATNLEIDLCSKLDFLHRCLEHNIWILAVACCFFVSKAFNHVLLKSWTPMPAWISLTALIQGGTVLCFTTGNKWTERYGWTPNSCPLFESYQHA